MSDQYRIHDAKTLSRLVPKGVDLIISSPPYFDMKDYGPQGQIGFGQTWEDYLNDMRTVFAECAKIVSDTGSMWLIVDTLKREGRQQLLPFHLVEVAQASGWKLQETIIWKKDRTLPFSAKGEMRNIFEYVLFLVRNDQFKYYPARITSYNFKQWWVKYPERYSTSGMAPTDVWEFPIPVQGSWGNRYIRHFCPLPEDLVMRIIDLCSDPGDVVLDPFAGSGAVLAAAYRCGRRFLGLDLNPEFKAMFDAYLPTLERRDNDEETAAAATVASTIKKLRLLKLPSALLKALRRDTPEAFAAVTSVTVSLLDEPCEERHTLWRAKYVFHIEDSFDGDAMELVRGMSRKPPLSKYGIEPRIEFQRAPLDQSDARWYYRWDATYRTPLREPDDQRPQLAATFAFDADEEALLSRYR